LSTVLEAIAADRRLAILRLLSVCCGNSHSGVLECALRHYSHMEFRNDLLWLERQGLVELAPPVPGLADVSLTPRGGYAAEGIEAIEGVARPQHLLPA
jgi:hypothetical protein